MQILVNPTVCMVLRNSTSKKVGFPKILCILNYCSFLYYFACYFGSKAQFDALTLSIVTSLRGWIIFKKNEAVMKYLTMKLRYFSRYRDSIYVFILLHEEHAKLIKYTPQSKYRFWYKSIKMYKIFYQWRQQKLLKVSASSSDRIKFIISHRINF